MHEPTPSTKVSTFANSLSFQWLAGRRSKSGPEHHIASRSILYWNFMLVESGQFRVRLGNEERVLKPGQAVLITPRQEHGYGMETTGVVSWIDFILECSSTISADHYLKFHPWLSKVETKGISQAIQTMDLDNKTSQQNSIQSLNRFIQARDRFIHQILSLASWHDLDQYRQRSVQRIQPLLENINAQLDYNWTRDDLCDYLDIGTTQLNKIFTEITGRPPRQYILERRLNKSANLLATTDWTCDAIAMHCGFSDTFHMSRRFKARYGFSPTHFRERVNTD